MRIYLDTSCLKRPFDDQTQARIRLETEAIVLILKEVERNQFQWCGSDVLLYENRNDPNVERRMKAEVVLGLCSEEVKFSEPIQRRGEQLVQQGIVALDALHLASAETADVDIFLTCDEQLLKTAQQITHLLRVKVRNPVDFLMEVGL